MAFVRAKDTEAVLRAVLAEVLGVPPEIAAEFDEGTPLFGVRPELDPLSVAGMLSELEERLAIRIPDRHVDAEALRTFGSVLRMTCKAARADRLRPLSPGGG